MLEPVESEESVVLPGPTSAPLVLSLGMALLAGGVVTGPLILLVGGVVLGVGLGLWVAELLPGRGHVHEPLVAPSRRPGPVTAAAGIVAHLEAGMPGYRLRLPTTV